MNDCEHCGLPMPEDRIGVCVDCTSKFGAEPSSGSVEYGRFQGGDPRNFHPDPEMSSEQEIKAHEVACDRAKLNPAERDLPANHCGQLTKFGIGVTILMVGCQADAAIAQSVSDVSSQVASVGSKVSAQVQSVGERVADVGSRSAMVVARVDSVVASVAGTVDNISPKVEQAANLIVGLLVLVCLLVLVTLVHSMVAHKRTRKYLRKRHR